MAAALGPSQEGYSIRFRYERADGSAVDATMAKRAVTIPTVSDLNVYEVDGRKIGYLFFRNFVTPSRQALDDAFNALRDVGATELVLDLRYNGGGLVSIAQHLASLIGGARTEGQIFAEYFHNARNAFRNEVTRFEHKDNTLSLQRLVVVTTGGSASASELVINALRPFIPVTTVGETTYGKPVGQYGITFCDKVLYPVAFTLRNALGQGDYFSGIAADCPAADDAGPPARRSGGSVTRRGADGGAHGAVLRATRQCGAGATARDHEGGCAAAKARDRATDRRALARRHVHVAADGARRD